MADEEKQEIKLATLDDLTATTIDAVVELEDGREVRMVLKTLSMFKITALQNSLPMPPPVMLYPDKEGRPVYDYNDAEYVKARDSVLIKRQLLVLAHIIQQPAIPGATNDEKVAWMEENFSPAVSDQLARLVKIINSKGEARIYSRAEMFHRDGTQGVTGVPENGVEHHLLEHTA